MPSNETECDKCKHLYFDHGGWMELEERARVEKLRRIGCRVVQCGCESFQVGVWEREYEIKFQPFV